MKRKQQIHDLHVSAEFSAWRRWLSGIHLLVLALLFTPACPADRPDSANTPRQMFEAVVSERVPKGVSRIEGTGDVRGGYQLFLRFRADGKARRSILSRYAYRRVACQGIHFPMNLSPSYDRFEGGWNPGAIKRPQCHEAEGVSNRWSSGGHHKLWIDTEGGMVYFTGVGI